MIQNSSTAQSKTPITPPNRYANGHHRIRTFFAASLGVLAIWLIFSSVMSVWLNRTLTDNATYTNTVAPLASSPAVQEFVVQKTTDAILDTSQTTDLANKLLAASAVTGQTPEQLKTLLRPVVSKNVRQVVESQAFADLWRSTNQTAQQQFIGQLKSNSSDLNLDLHPVLTGVVAELNKTQLSSITGQIEIKPETGVLHAKNTNLRQARSYYGWLKRGTIAMTLLTIVAISGAVALSVNHIKTVRRILVGTGLSMLTLALLLQAPALLELNGKDAVTQRAAIAIAQTLLHGLQVTSLVIGIACIVAALVSKLMSRRNARVVPKMLKR